MSNDLKRYAFDATRGEMFEIAHGAYVKHDDHSAVLAAAVQAEREACIGAVMRCEDPFGGHEPEVASAWETIVEEMVDSIRSRGPAPAVQAEREAIKAHIDSDAFMPSEWAQRQPLDVYAWERGVADVMTYIDSRGPAPAVDVISEDFAVTMKTIATVYEERDRVMAVVREFVYAFDAARSAFEDESVVDDAYVEAENRSEKAWAALRALVDGGGKGEKKIMGDDQCTTR